MKKTAIALLVLVAAVVLAGAGCRKKETPAAAKPAASSPPAATASGADVGAAMPEYTSQWLDGSSFDLARYRGDKVVLLNVWATWCGPCRVEIPELQTVHDKYKGRGFEVIGVSVDESGPEAVKEFVAEQKMTYPVALDAEGKLASILDTTVLPTTVLLDRNGKIVWKKYGAIMPGDPELIQAVEKAL